MAASTESRVRRLLGGQIRRFRKDRGWTQTDLAAKLNLTLDMVGRIERGTASPSIETVAKLAQKFEVPVAALFGCSLNDARAGERSKAIESIVATLNRLDLKELERIRRILLAASSP